MKIAKRGSRVLWYECFGFSLNIVLVWLEEWSGWQALMFGGTPHVRDWRNSAMVTLLVVFIWAIVLGFTQRLIRRLHYMEGLLRVCAWCRKVGHNGQWMKVEDYFADGFHINTTHGMCPDCFKRVQEDTAHFRKIAIQNGGTALTVKPCCNAGQEF